MLVDCCSSSPQLMSLADAELIEHISGQCDNEVFVTATGLYASTVLLLGSDICTETENVLCQHDDVVHLRTIYFALYKCTHCLSNAMHGQNINLRVCVCLSLCVCVRHTFYQLADRSDRLIILTLTPLNLNRWPYPPRPYPPDLNPRP